MSDANSIHNAVASRQMNPPVWNPSPLPTIGRATFALRMSLALVVGSASLFAFYAGVMKSGGHSGTALLAFLAFAIVGGALLLGLIINLVWLPRLRDIGLDGPVLWVAVAGCILPPTATILLIALLFIPTGFVQKH